jgi:hypothetical protein
MLIDSLFFLAREAWPLLERTGGTLVAVSSVARQHHGTALS